MLSVGTLSKHCSDQSFKTLPCRRSHKQMLHKMMFLCALCLVWFIHVNTVVWNNILFCLRPCHKNVELQPGGLSSAKYEVFSQTSPKTKQWKCICFLWASAASPLSCLCVAVEEAASIASVSLRPLEGMGAVDVAAATSRACDGAALGALLKLCNGWQKPGAVLQGQCILVSQTKFEVDVGYNADVIAAFKQMPTKNYGNTIFFRSSSQSFIVLYLHSTPFDLRLLLMCPYQTWKPESGAFYLRITRDSVSNNTFSFFSWFLSALLFVSDTFAILSDRAVFHTQWIASAG